MLHVAQISFFLDPQGREPAQLLRDWWSLVDVAEAASQAGMRVSVIQACAKHERLRRDGVDYYFLPPDRGTSALVKSAAFSTLLRELSADVFHVHGLGFPSDVLALAALAPDTPILVQDHANRPPRIWRRGSWRRGLSVASGIAFCSAAQAQPFYAAGLISPRTRIYEIPESSTRFTPGDQVAARRQTGLHGDPCLLWVGHLNHNKDPLTVLDGISRAVSRLPQLQLWCCFGVAPLMADVRARIGQDPALRGRVSLMGTVPHEKIEQLMRAADLFVLGSHQEGSGYSLIEALACGLPPVVTDIPSFRTLTGSGEIGRLWTPGNAAALAESLCWIAQRLGPKLRTKTRGHFDKDLSFSAVGRRFADCYAELAAGGPCRPDFRCIQPFTVAVGHVDRGRQDLGSGQ